MDKESGGEGKTSGSQAASPQRHFFPARKPAPAGGRMLLRWVSARRRSERERPSPDHHHSLAGDERPASSVAGIGLHASSSTDALRCASDRSLSARAWAGAVHLHPGPSHPCRLPFLFPSPSLAIRIACRPRVSLGGHTQGGRRQVSAASSRCLAFSPVARASRRSTAHPPCHGTNPLPTCLLANGVFAFPVSHGLSAGSGSDSLTCVRKASRILAPFARHLAWCFAP